MTRHKNPRAPLSARLRGYTGWGRAVSGRRGVSDRGTLSCTPSPGGSNRPPEVAGSRSIASAVAMGSPSGCERDWNRQALVHLEHRAVIK